MAYNEAESKRIVANLTELHQKGLIRLEKVSVELPNHTWNEVSFLDFLRLMNENPSGFRRFSFTYVDTKENDQ